jgi:MarR family transcriptional regulator, 2-MHQ and catechol-resistance regulon repressor
MALTTLTHTDPGLRSDAEALRRAVSDLIRVYSFRDRDRICCHDVSVTQCYALEALAERGPLTLNDLAAGLFLDKSTASRVVDGLQRKGYAERQENPESRRSILVGITPQGEAVRARIEQDVLADEMRLLQGVPPEVRRGAAELVARLAAAAAARVDTSGGSCCSL